jgi:hypothetical protein
MKRLFATCLLLLAIAPAVQAQDLSTLYGGWIADIDGQRHVHYIVLRNDTVSGTYCFDCAHPGNLAIIDDGELTADGLRFVRYHYPENAAAYTEQVDAVLQDGKLQLRITKADGSVRNEEYRRTRADERVVLPMPDATPNAQTGPGLTGRERVLPGPAEAITPQAMAGLWLWGTGPGKQHFMFVEHKGGLRGLVCGPCDSAPDFAPLELIRIEGDTLHFDIVHEDNGMALAEHGPHSNVTSARLSRHELHMSVIPSYEGPDFQPIEMTLLGPVRD